MTLLNILWFVAGHVSLIVLALAYGRHAVGHHHDNPWYKDGYRAGRAEGLVEGRKENAQLYRAMREQIKACEDAIGRYEKRLAEAEEATPCVVPIRRSTTR